MDAGRIVWPEKVSTEWNASELRVVNIIVAESYKHKIAHLCFEVDSSCEMQALIRFDLLNQVYSAKKTLQKHTFHSFV
jgi:hypothetical protein